MELPLPIVYGQLHAYMQEQGIACITPAERERRQSAAEAMMNAAMNF